jgi:predicted XRE-type DNA-binding protein
MASNKHLGSSFDSFLEEQGMLEEVEAIAIKRVLASEVAEYLTVNNVRKSVFAKRIQTSRSQLDRLLDAENPSVTLQTMVKAARGIGKKLELRLG